MIIIIIDGKTTSNRIILIENQYFIFALLLHFIYIFVTFYTIVLGELSQYFPYLFDCFFKQKQRKRELPHYRNSSLTKIKNTQKIYVSFTC